MPNYNIKAMQAMTYDAIVVGSGISGGWAAKELCEAGLKTLVLERGRLIDPTKDFTTMSKESWDYELHGGITPEDRKKHYKAIRSGFIGEGSKMYYANDEENPYTEVKPFLWIRAHQLGGPLSVVGTAIVSVECAGL